MDDAILEEQPAAFGPAYASVYRHHTTSYRPEPEPEAESMPEEGNVHDWYAALNETRREAREHTDSVTGEIRREMREDRQEILGAIRDSQTMVLEQINQVAGDLSNTRTELHRDITSVRDIADDNSKGILRINTFGQALLIFITVLSAIGTVAAAVGGFF